MNIHIIVAIQRFDGLHIIDQFKVYIIQENWTTLYILQCTDK